MTPEENDIRISRETLRNEIRLANAELELSLRKWILIELDKKASADLVTDLANNLSRVEHSILSSEERNMVRSMNRGEFSRAQKGSVEDIFDELMRDRSNTGWSKRERIITVFGITLWMLTTILSLLALIGKP